jgi:hypothetical protein
MADHDQRFKVLLREFFAEFIQLRFPTWASHFDFRETEWLDQEVYSDPPQGQRQVVDLVARVPVRQELASQKPDNQERWITLVHVEVESDDTVAPLRRRMWEYYWQLRQRHGLPVLPIAVYLRAGLGGVGWDGYEEWFWDQQVVQFRYAYLGLPGLNALDYVEGSNSLGVALAALMRMPEDQQAELKANMMQRLATASENEWRRFLLCECVEAYLPLVGPQIEEYNHLLLTERYKEAHVMAMTTYEKGIEKGIEMGIEKGQRILLQGILEKKFGPLGKTTQERLASWPAERLTEVGAALVHAHSLRDLGLED